MNEVFFRASQDALDNITSVFDFVHPLTASMKFTGDKVAELHKKGKAADEIAAIIDPTHSVHGANYTRAFVETAWSEQEEKLAWLLLNNLFAIHEGWVQRLFDETFKTLSFDERDFTKKLESTKLNSSLKHFFVPTATKSSLMVKSFYPVYKRNCALDFGKLDNYMLCYRYFKEARNCYMHRNCIASKKLMKAYKAFISKATTSDLDVSEVPIVLPPTLGNPVRLSLRGVIGFSQIVQRIITLSDINLMCSMAAEKELAERVPQNWRKRTFSANQAAAAGQANSYARKAGFIGADWSTEYRDYLLSKKKLNI